MGLPGDDIQMVDGVLRINGKPVTRRRVGDFAADLEGDRSKRVARYEEVLPNGVTYQVLGMDPHAAYANTGVFKVPPGRYFMLGDNRGNSIDSRMQGHGFVPIENLIGRMVLVVVSVDASTHHMRWERVLVGIR